MLPGLVPVALALAACCAPAHADVLVADGSVPLQDVVDAANDGDIVLVKPSLDETAGVVSIAGRSLTLAGDGGAPRIGRVRVLDLPAGGHVTLRSLRIGPEFPVVAFGVTGSLEVTGCHGAVWIEDCSVSAPQQLAVGAGIGLPGMAGAVLTQSAAVTLLRSQLVGGDGAPELPSCTIPGYGPATRGGDGVRAVSSTVTLHGCELTGGRGGVMADTGCFASGAAGGDGLFVQDASVHAAGSAIAGGDMDPHLNGSSAPGSGLRVLTAASDVTLRGGSVTAGTGPTPVPDVVAPGGTVTTYPAPPRALAVSGPLREGEAGQLVVRGQPGDLTALFLSLAGGALPLPGKQGVHALGGPLLGPIVLGVNPSGEWTLPFVAGALVPPTVQGQAFLLQLYVQAPGGEVLVEGDTAFVLIDASIP